MERQDWRQGNRQQPRASAVALWVRNGALQGASHRDGKEELGLSGDRMQAACWTSTAPAITATTLFSCQVCVY